MKGKLTPVPKEVLRVGREQYRKKREECFNSPRPPFSAKEWEASLVRAQKVKLPDLAKGE